MSKIRAAVVGYGNIGRFVVEAIEASEDFELAGVVRRNASDIPAELRDCRVVGDITELEKVDVAILTTPSRLVEQTAMKILPLGIATVDSFDIHTEIPAVRARLDSVARQHGTAVIMSAGWDPGSDSVVRALLMMCAPKGITYTNFGPGMSMGHSVAVRAIKGVRDALSMTIPLGTGIHRRMVYVELEDGCDFAAVEAAVKSDPYFIHDETHVSQVRSVSELRDMGHGVDLIRKGVSGKTHDQIFRFGMTINNPALTGQILVSAARAVLRQRPGAYTMIEIPPVDFLPGDRADLVAALV